MGENVVVTGSVVHASDHKWLSADATSGMTGGTAAKDILKNY